MARSKPLQGLLFDVGDTLLAPHPSFPELFALVMGELERSPLVAVGVGVPVEPRFERTTILKYPGRYRSRGPYLAAVCVDVGSFTHLTLPMNHPV